MSSKRMSGSQSSRKKLRFGRTVPRDASATTMTSNGAMLFTRVAPCIDLLPRETVSLASVRPGRYGRAPWITSTDLAEPVRLTAAGDNVLELSVSDKGTVVVAVGPVGDSKLAIIESNKNAALIPLSGVVRYPAISADGERLVFSRRLSGSWNLVLYSLKDHKETSLMDYPCNATEPSWADDHTILYASDCGRGIGFTAIAKIGVP